MGHCRKPLFIPLLSLSPALLSPHARAQEPPEPAERKSQDASAQNPQEKPDQKKNESPNPAQAGEKRKDLTGQAADATKHMAKQGLVRLRDWESGWLTGVYVEMDQPLVSLTRQVRRQIYLRQTLATPGAYLKRAFAAGIDQVRIAPSQWDDGLRGYAERFASREG